MSSLKPRNATGSAPAALRGLPTPKVVGEQLHNGVDNAARRSRMSNFLLSRRATSSLMRSR